MAKFKNLNIRFRLYQTKLSQKMHSILMFFQALHYQNISILYNLALNTFTIDFTIIFHINLGMTKKIRLIKLIFNLNEKNINLPLIHNKYNYHCII